MKIANGAYYSIKINYAKKLVLNGSVFLARKAGSAPPKSKASLKPGSNAGFHLSKSPGTLLRPGYSPERG